MEYTGAQETHTQLLFSMQDGGIPAVGVFSFRVKAEKIKGKNLIIGVVNRQMGLGLRTSHSKGYSVAYSSYMGTRYPPKI